MLRALWAVCLFPVMMLALSIIVLPLLGLFSSTGDLVQRQHLDDNDEFVAISDERAYRTDCGLCE